ncbi:MAG: hypothetical protein AAFU54_09795 [Chloroflexota bacterium]
MQERTFLVGENGRDQLTLKWEFGIFDNLMRNLSVYVNDKQYIRYVDNKQLRTGVTIEDDAGNNYLIYISGNIWVGERIHIKYNSRSLPQSGTNPNFFVFGAFVYLLIVSLLTLIGLPLLPEGILPIIAIVVAVFYIAVAVIVRREARGRIIFLGVAAAIYILDSLFFVLAIMGTVLETVSPELVPSVFGGLIIRFFALYYLIRGTLSLVYMQEERETIQKRMA